jgi:hypothetical protein
MVVGESVEVSGANLGPARLALVDVLEVDMIAKELCTSIVFRGVPSESH